MRPFLHHRRPERAAERRLRSEAARRWYRQERSNDGVARRLEAIRVYREPGSDRERQTAWRRQAPRVIGLALVTVAAAAITLLVLWPGGDATPSRPTAPLAGAPANEPAADRPMAAPFGGLDLHAICSSITVAVQNSSGKRTLAVALVGAQDLGSAMLGHGLMFPLQGVAIDLPASGRSVLAAIPCDITLPGMIGYLQTVELDPSRSAGVLYTVGLSLLIDGC